jgi:hypothetical protein
VQVLRGIQILSTDTEMKALFNQLCKDKIKQLNLAQNIEKAPLLHSKRKDELLEVVNEITKMFAE